MSVLTLIIVILTLIIIIAALRERRIQCGKRKKHQRTEHRRAPARQAFAEFMDCHTDILLEILKSRRKNDSTRPDTRRAPKKGLFRVPQLYLRLQVAGCPNLSRQFFGSRAVYQRACPYLFHREHPDDAAFGDLREIARRGGVDARLHRARVLAPARDNGHVLLALEHERGRGRVDPRVGRILP